MRPMTKLLRQKDGMEWVDREDAKEKINEAWAIANERSDGKSIGDSWCALCLAGILAHAQVAAVR